MLMFDPAVLQMAKAYTPKPPPFPVKPPLKAADFPHILVYGPPNTGKTSAALSAFPDAAAFQMANSHLSAQTRYGLVASGETLGSPPIAVNDTQWATMDQGLKMPDGKFQRHPLLALSTVERVLLPKLANRPVILDEWTNWEQINKKSYIDGRFVTDKGAVDGGAEWLTNGTVQTKLVNRASALKIPLIVLGHEVQAGTKTFMDKTTAFNEGVAASSQKQAEKFTSLFGLRVRTEKRLFAGTSRFVFAADPFKLRATQTDRLDIIRGVCPANLRAVLWAAGFAPAWDHYRVAGDSTLRVEGATIGALVLESIQEGIGILWGKTVFKTPEELVAVFRALRVRFIGKLRELPVVKELGLDADPTLILWGWETIRDSIELVVGFYESEATSI